MGEINKKFGFYGTIKSCFDKDSTERIWDVTVKKLREMYPNKTEDEIIEFLNARTGRHFADELLDEPEDVRTMGYIMVKVAMLNKLKMAPWWSYHYDIKPVAVIDRVPLFKAAIKYEMRKKSIRDLVASVVGCGTDQVWNTPEIWLESEHTTVKELIIMWNYIQEKLTKRTKHGHSGNIRKETGSC